MAIKINNNGNDIALTRANSRNDYRKHPSQFYGQTWISFDLLYLKYWCAHTVLLWGKELLLTFPNKVLWIIWLN